VEEFTMYKTVIVPVDGSRLAEAALGPATVLAKRCDAEVLLFSVVDDRKRQDARDSYLGGLADQITGVPVKSLVALGAEPAVAIADVAREEDRAIVCMSTPGRGGVARVLLGSVAEDVLRRMIGPVLLTGPHTRPDASPVAGQLMVCLDGSHHGEAILPLAAAWAQQFAMELYLVQVLDPDVERQLRAAKVPTGDVREDAYLARVARRLRDEGIPVDWEVLHGTRSADAIIDRARHPDVSLVALSTLGRTGLRGVAIGSVARHIVHDNPSPTLLLRPIAPTPIDPGSDDQ
jgi:nucleotide-binding universal stress UspA family protein